MSSWVSRAFLPYFVVLCLLPCTYILFGWYTAEQLPAWSRAVQETTDKMEVSLSLEILTKIGYALAIAIMLAINLSLTVMTKPMTALFTNWFKSDVRAILSVLGWSLAIVVIFRWIHYFLRLTLLFCVASLSCLELQKQGKKKWLILSILTLLSFGGFALGVWLFNHLSKNLV